MTEPEPELPTASKKLSYRASLPSRDLHILIVGPTHLTKPLATALLQVTFEPTTKQKHTSNDDNDADDDAAISALRRLYPPPAPIQRRIHLCHRLDAVSSQVRMDHVIFVSQDAKDETTTPTTTTSTTQPPASLLSIQQALLPPPPHAALHEDYTLMQRVSMVRVLDPQVRQTRTKRRKTTIPCFFVSENETNHSVARMLLQRAHVGARDTGASPMVFGTYG
jgi:hypothetical protein